MVKVSVIVPVYNAGEFLKTCAESILKQSLHDIEVIFVDDGSTDDSREILEDYQHKDPRVSVITQQNMYAGVARNNGLKRARGEYVVFWDSDDYFDRNALKRLYDAASGCNADICVGEAVKINMETGERTKSRFIRKSLLPDKRPFSREDIPRYIFTFTSNYLWIRMFRREFIEQTGLQFADSKRANDVFFSMATAVLAERITVIDDVITYYRFLNTNSLSSTPLNNCEYVIRAYKEVQQLLKDRGLWDNDDIRISYINRLYTAIHFQFSYTGSYDDFIRMAKRYKEALLEIDPGDVAEEDFLSKKRFRAYNALLNNTPEQYLFDHYLYYREANRSNENKYRKEKKKNKELRKSKAFRIGKRITGVVKQFSRK